MRSVVLEFVRPGRPFNHLLGRDTSYLALYEDQETVTLAVDLDQVELHEHLGSIRYDPSDGTPWNEDDHGKAIATLGGVVTAVLAKVPGLVDAIRNAESEPIHLRLITTPLEIAMLPFELCTDLEGSAGGSPQPLLIDRDVEVTLTREVRHTSPRTLTWPTQPRVLLVVADRSFDELPYRQHEDALWQALEDIRVCDPRSGEARRDPGHGILRVLAGATLADVARACREAPFTHVHILAHGAAYRHRGQRRFGVLMGGDDDSRNGGVVTGEELASALTQDVEGIGVHRPTVVTLATCDSGHESTVLLPGASAAYELHTAGIPFVLASQFDLLAESSTLIVRAFHASVLRGDHPCLALRRLRQKLAEDGAQRHDWAGVVAYTRLPDDLERQLVRTRLRWLVLGKTAAASAIVEIGGSGDPPGGTIRGIEAIIGQIEALQDRTSTLRRSLGLYEEPGMDPLVRERLHAEYWALTGSLAKRRAEAEWWSGYLRDGSKPVDRGRAHLETARGAYRDGHDHFPLHHWTAVQCLTLTAILDGTFSPADEDRWTLARHGSELNLANAVEPHWAIVSMIELELLRCLLPSETRTVDGFDQADRWLHKLLQRSHEAPDRYAEARASLQRQLRRYTRWWKPFSRHGENLRPVIEQAERLAGKL